MNEPEPNSDDLDPRDEQVAALLAVGRTEIEVAAELNVSRSTVQRSARKHPVQRLLRQYRRSAAGTAIGLLSEASSQAATTLIGLTKSAGRDDAVKLRACLGLLRITLEQVAVSDLEKELIELRVMLESEKPNPQPPWVLPPEDPPGDPNPPPPGQPPWPSTDSET